MSWRRLASSCLTAGAGAAVSIVDIARRRVASLRERGWSRRGANDSGSGRRARTPARARRARTTRASGSTGANASPGRVGRRRPQLGRSRAGRSLAQGADLPVPGASTAATRAWTRRGSPRDGVGGVGRGLGLGGRAGSSGASSTAPGTEEPAGSSGLANASPTGSSPAASARQQRRLPRQGFDGGSRVLRGLGGRGRERGSRLVDRVTGAGVSSAGSGLRLGLLHAGRCPLRHKRVAVARDRLGERFAHGSGAGGVQVSGAGSAGVASETAGAAST